MHNIEQASVGQSVTQIRVGGFRGAVGKIEQKK
jgi:hypothetical protein